MKAMMITTLDGCQFVANGYGHAVRQLKGAAWMHDDPKLEYMLSVAIRVEQQLGVMPRLTVKEFIKDLSAMGYLKVEAVN
jgi:hypothetical protein